jgi:hypothetical protein
MQRRSFMKSVLLASLAGAGRPGFLRAEVLAPTGSERFAAGLASWRRALIVKRRVADPQGG